MLSSHDFANVKTGKRKDIPIGLDKTEIASTLRLLAEKVEADEILFQKVDVRTISSLEDFSETTLTIVLYEMKDKDEKAIEIVTKKLDRN